MIADIRAEVQELQDQLELVRDILAWATKQNGYGTEVWGYLEGYVYSMSLIQEFLDQPHVSSWYLSVLSIGIVDAVLANDHSMRAEQEFPWRVMGQNYVLVHIVRELMPIIIKFKELDNYDSEQSLATNARKPVKSPKRITRKRMGN